MAPPVGVYAHTHTQGIRTRIVSRQTVTVVAPVVIVESEADSDSDTGTIVPATGKKTATTKHRTATVEGTASADSSEDEDV